MKEGISHLRKVAIIASEPGLETAFKVFNIALAATTMDAEVHVFCTFGGLQMLRKEPNFEIPESLAPFSENLKELPTIEELRSMSLESGVNFVACQMTIDLMGSTSNDFISGIEFGGAAAFLAQALDADTTITF